jgi:hypothetical protein
MNKEQLNLKLNSKADSDRRALEAQKENDRRRRVIEEAAKQCEVRADAVVTSFKDFLHDTAPEGSFPVSESSFLTYPPKPKPQPPFVQEVVVDRRDDADLVYGPGKLVARVTAWKGHKQLGYDDLDKMNTASVEVVFVADETNRAREIDTTGFNSTSTLEQLYDSSSDHSKESRVGQVQQNLDRAEREAQETLDMLFDCARDPALNPELAARLEPVSLPDSA